VPGGAEFDDFSVRRLPPSSHRGTRSRKPMRWVDHLEGEVMELGPACTGTWCPAAAGRPVGGYLADGHGRDSPHPCAIDGSARAAERPDSTAPARRSLIRMRSQVQVLAGPRPIPAGQGAAGSEPGALAASLGRAGAAPHPAGTSSGPSGSAHPAVRLGGDHAPWSPWSRTQPPTAATRRVRPPRTAACSRAPQRSRSGGCSARRPGRPGRSAVTRGRRGPHQPGGPGPPPTSH
jgi:hypothetical protein